MNVELLYFEGCPNSRIVHDRLTVLEAELGIHLSRREVSTPEDAERLRLYRAAHVAGAVSIPLAELERRLRELPPDREVVAYCRGPTAPLRQKRFVPSASTATLLDTSPTGCQDGPTPEETSR